MNFSYSHIELCATDDKRASFYVSEAERNGMQVIQINNKNYVLIVNEYIWRAADAKFKKIASATYVFKE